MIQFKYNLFYIQVVSFDGSTTVEEFLSTLSSELSCREPAVSGFTLFSDDPIEKDMEHHIKSDKKVFPRFFLRSELLLMYLLFIVM